MKKSYLISHRSPKLLVLADWTDYELEIETIWLWGLFKTKKITTYRVYDHQDVKTFFDHWDKLISEKTQLKSDNLSILGMLILIIIIPLIIITAIYLAITGKSVD